MTRWLYSARVFPLNRPASIRGEHGQPVTFAFDEFCLSRSRNWAREHTIPVLIGHDHDLRIGHLTSLEPNRDWFVVGFQIDEPDIEFPVGQNVSVGLTWREQHPDQPDLQELSIVRQGRIPGAEITLRVPAPSPPRTAEQAKPKPTPARTTRPQPAIVHRQPISSRHQAEHEELDRRLRWLEQHTGRPADVEAVVIGMRRELDGPTLDDLARHGRHAA